MSGGVDSSVAAALLIEDGYDVIGVSMNLFSCDRPLERSCCTAQDRLDACRVCERLNIPHRVVDSRVVFRNEVINPFIEEYAAGRTPSPCILCNERVKFRILIGEAEKSGAHYIATGHYARTERRKTCVSLLRACDHSKDQSYFLFRLRQPELMRTLFPLGEISKRQVRGLARKMGLVTHDKAESQEVCFVPGSYAAFLEEHAASKLQGPGNFVDVQGRVLGRHRGIHAYTIGQRRGLGFGIGRRQYVVGINGARNEVVLGQIKDLLRREMIVRDVSWTWDMPADLAGILVRIRSTHAGERARLVIEGDRVIAFFDKPVRAIAPGQAAVFYRDDEVLGGGWIE